MDSALEPNMKFGLIEKKNLSYINPLLTIKEKCPCCNFTYGVRKFWFLYSSSCCGKFWIKE